MSEATPLRRRLRAGALGMSSRGSASWMATLILALLMSLSGPLSLAHATIHHVGVAASQNAKLASERSDIAAGVIITSTGAGLHQLGQPQSPEQALLEQHCVVCQWLQAPLARTIYLSERDIPAVVAYVMPFDSQAAKFAPPPLQRPPRS